MGGGGNVWKRVPFLGSRTSSRRGLGTNILVLTKPLHEAASLPASWAAAVSYQSLSASSKAVKTARQLCLVPEAELIKPHPHLHLNGILGGRAGKLQTATCCLYIFLDLRQSIIPELSSLIHPGHCQGASRHLTVHTRHGLYKVTPAIILEDI